MCSIMAYCSRSAAFDTFMEGFKETISRGPDDTRVVEVGGGLLGFHRLAIMGLTPSGMQPFQYENDYAICNGEIYGFEKWKEALSGKYTFESESDCEILLPLYREYGTDMFAMLDAEFACVIYDGAAGEFIAARDPIGIRPLYYGYDKDGSVIFASEAKNLVGLSDKIMPFPPGHYYKEGAFICYCDCLLYTSSSDLRFHRRRGRDGCAVCAHHFTTKWFLFVRAFNHIHLAIQVKVGARHRKGGSPLTGSCFCRYTLKPLFFCIIGLRNG